LCKDRGVLFHTDAAQAVGKLDVDVRKVQADYLSFTGHKFHAPMGIGVLYRCRSSPLIPLLGGGMQESGFRPGSQNLAGIAGVGIAARIRRQRLHQVRSHTAAMRDAFENSLFRACTGARLNTEIHVDRVCNTTNVRFCGVDGQALLAQLIATGICCSQGSACTSQIPEPSHTLLAMGLTHEAAYQSIRFSFSEMNTYPEVEQAIAIVASAYDRLKAILAGCSHPVTSGGAG
jgi:cysteine desulfurase